MLDSLTIQLPQMPMNGAASDSAACCMKPGQTVPQAAENGEGFKEILSAFLSGLEDSMKELKEGVLMNGQGRNITLEDLAKAIAGTVSAEGEESAADVSDAVAALQQMISQLQATMAQPVVLINPGHPTTDGASGDDLSLKAHFHTAGSRSFLTVTAKSEEGAAKVSVRLDEGEAARVKAAVSFNAAMPTVEQPAPAADTVSETAHATATAHNPHDIPPLPAEHSADDAAAVKIVSTPASDPKSAPSAASQARPGVGSIELSAAPAAATGAGETAAAAAHVPADVAAEISAVEAGGKTDVAAAAEPKEAAPTHTAAVNVAHTPYVKDKQAVKETVHISRLHEVSEPMMKTLGAGDKQLIIKLSPPDLGDIQIKLKMENGVLSADFKVDSAAVKELFSLAIPQIKHSIENSGVRAGEFFVDLHEEGYADGRTSHEQAQQQGKRQREPESRFFDYFA